MFEVREAGLGSADTNGAGFNAANANFPTNLAADAGTGNTASPVVSSATYNFLAADVGAYLFYKAGANSLPGWYPIASVAANKATLDAVAGENCRYMGAGYSMLAMPATNVDGIATVGAPTNGTWGIDYSQQDAPRVSVTDAVTNGTTTVTSATAAFHPGMVGNLVYLAGGTGAVAADWYEIVSYTNATTIVVDRATGLTAGTGVTLKLGGALATYSAGVDRVTVSNVTVWFKKGAAPFGIGVTKTVTLTNQLCGYTTRRGEFGPFTQTHIKATADSINMLACGTSSIVPTLFNLTFDADKRTTVRCVHRTGNFPGWYVINCRLINGLSGISGAQGAATHTFYDTEISGHSGDGVDGIVGAEFMNCLIGRNGGVGIDGSSIRLWNCIVAKNGTVGAYGSNGNGHFEGNTFAHNGTYGAQAGASGTSGGITHCQNNIVWRNGSAGIVNHGTLGATGSPAGNHFSRWRKNAYRSGDAVPFQTPIAVITFQEFIPPESIELTASPFIGPFWAVGVAWTAATKRLVETGAFVDAYVGGKVQIVGGTGMTPGRYDIAAVISNDEVELATSAGASDATDVEIYPIYELNDLAGGGALLRDTGHPGTYPGGVNVGYRDIGPLQHEETGGGGGGGGKFNPFGSPIFKGVAV
jgi:hypothetical protein